MFLILIVVIVLVAWALHLMQEAVDRQEFSLMLAGFLVSSAAAGLVAVYLLINHSFAYMTDMERQYYLQQQAGRVHLESLPAQSFFGKTALKADL